MTADEALSLVDYTRWANARLYESLERLPAEEISRGRPAFFGSILGTLNHILVADTLWLARLEQRPMPPLTLDSQIHDSLPALRQGHEEANHALRQHVAGLGEEGLAKVLSYRTMDGSSHNTPVSLVLTHVVNHGTHHRGQVHGMMSATSEPPPPLDLVFYLRDKAQQG